MQHTKKRKQDNQNYDERLVGEMILVGGNMFVYWTEQTHY